MTQTRDIYKPTLVQHDYNLNHLFYLGEFGLKPEYQGQGIEKTMYDKIENFAKKSGKFSTICFFEVDAPSPAMDPSSGYIPKSDFWKKLGFIRHPELHFTIFWTNIKESVESPHVATYWMKKL